MSEKSVATKKPKNITFTYKGTDYVLEYTRNSIKRMESDGFSPSEYEKKPMTVMNDLFRGAFLAHHRSVGTALIDEMFEKIADKEGFFSVLVDLYQAPFEAITDSPTEGEITWKVGQ